MAEASGLIWVFSLSLFGAGLLFSLVKASRRLGKFLIVASFPAWFLSMAMCAAAMSPSPTPAPTPTPTPTPGATRRDLPAAPALEPERPKGKWKPAAQTRSAMDDTVSVGYVLMAEDPHGLAEHRIPRLMIACEEKKTIAYVDTREVVHWEIDGPNDQAVRIRFDDGPAESERWTHSTDKEALFSPRPESIARRVAKSGRFRLEFTPLKQAPSVIEFQTAGFDRAIGEIAKSCGWKP